MNGNTELATMPPHPLPAWYIEERRRAGVKGGKAKAAKMTRSQRSAMAKAMVQAREAKRKRS
jgi:hypothetical protein